MNESSTSNPGQSPFTFSPFRSNIGVGEGVSAVRAKVLRVVLKSLRQVERESRAGWMKVAAASIFKRRIVSRHSFDVYGCPSILTGWEAILHVIAWPTVIGVVIGYGLVISLAVLHSAAPLKPQSSEARAQVASMEASP